MKNILLTAAERMPFIHDHLDEVNMGYFEHLKGAWRYAAILFIHGLFPFIWETKVSDEIIEK